ncbi:MAG TPA: hypothetical protein VMG81_06260 [Thermoplasmata archaeon]|nr:hypothetical protein [Thermoplasmata archaeon]
MQTAASIGLGLAVVGLIVVLSVSTVVGVVLIILGAGLYVWGRRQPLPPSSPRK